MLRLALSEGGVWVMGAGGREDALVTAAACVALLIGLVGLVLTVHGVLAMRDLKKRDARLAAACWRCRYDLTGVTGPVCPECGWEIPKGYHGV